METVDIVLCILGFLVFSFLLGFGLAHALGEFAKTPPPTQDHHHAH